MTTSGVLLNLLCQLFLVSGQILLKHAMNQTNPTTPTSRGVKKFFLLGVASLTLYFFLWVGLLEKFHLSQLFPFEGIQPLLVVFAAYLFLKEKLTPRSWLGLALVTTGIILVSTS